jgi:predicted  nucleic acid-binding Zn-ribbon protein
VSSGWQATFAVRATAGKPREGWSRRNVKREGGQAKDVVSNRHQQSAIATQQFYLMHPDLQHLIQLQDLDLAAERARRRIAELPVAQQALEARVAEKTAAVTRIKELIAAGQAARREVEKELAVVQGRLSKYKGQLMEVKTNKEYQAMQKEMAAAEHDVRAHEDKLLEHMEQAETFAAELKAAETAQKTEQTVVARDLKVFEAERVEIEQELVRLTAARTEVVATLSREVLALFERVAHGRKGVAVAEARDGLCTVCHVRLRPQVFNEVRRNDGLHQCDSCTRILYFVPSSAPGTAPQAS